MMTGALYDVHRSFSRIAVGIDEEHLLQKRDRRCDPARAFDETPQHDPDVGVCKVRYRPDIVPERPDRDR